MLAAVALVAYPLLVWVGLTRGSPRRLALVLLAVLLPAIVIRMRASTSRLRGLALLPLVTVAALLITAVLDTAGLVLFVPLAINALLLAGFGSTLRAGSQPLIERLARLQQPALSAEQQQWCRLWTWIWCAFFVLNGGTALGLALAAPLSWWAVYNGLVAYGLMGALFAVEWLLRRRRFGPAATAPGALRATSGAGEAPSPPAPANLRLTWEEPQTSSTAGHTLQTFRTHVPEDYAFFNGHFPGYPVLAAAVQLHELVLPCLARALPQAGPLTRLAAVKFPGRIRPGDDIEVTLDIVPGVEEVQFEITRSGERCTTGRLCVMAAASAGSAP
jgi:uncharacterized membrane protein